MDDKIIDIETEEKPDETAPDKMMLSLVTGKASAVIKAVAEQADAVVQIKSSMLRLCTPRDFQEIDGNPHLKEDGAIKLIGPLQIDMELDRFEKIEYGDGTYEWVFYGRARCGVFGTSWVPIVGSRWSGDKFYTHQRDPIDPGDVRKAAYTNFRWQCVTESAGLGGLTWEMIGQNVDQSKVASYSHDDTSQQARSMDTGNTSLIREYHTLTSAGTKKGDEYTGVVTKLKVTSGNKKDGNQYIRTAITLKTDSGSLDASTFDTKIGGVLLGAYENGFVVTMAIVDDGQYKTIHGAKHAEEQST